MSTVEKLLVQIFERKDAIIEKVKQQTELYNQHLASKLLIDGISPPTWLWNPNTCSSSKGLNKEELICKLLCPYPQPSIRRSVSRYPVYNNLVATGDNEEISDGSFMENLAISKGLNRPVDPTVPALSSEGHAGCALNSVPEPDASVTSPEDQTDERILDVYSASDPSLAGIQRSKSRQRALELRHSAKVLAKSGLSHENISDPFSSQIRFSLSASNLGDQDGQPKFAEPSVIDGQGCGNGDLLEADHLSKEKGMDVYSGGISRSRSNAEVPVSVRDSLTLGCSSQGRKDSSPSHVAELRRKGSIPISDPEQADNYVNKFPKSSGPSTISCQSCGDRKVDGADCLSKGSEINVYSGGISRSKISDKCQSCACNSSKADSSSHNYERIDIDMVDTGDDLPPGYVDRELLRIDPSNVLTEGCEAQESMSEDCKSQGERGAVPPSSCSQQNAFVDEVSDLDIPSHSARADSSIVAPSTGRSAQHVSDSNEVLGLVRPSVGLFRRVTRSQTRSNNKEMHEPVDYNENTGFEGKMSKSVCKEKSAVNDGIQNTSSVQFIQPSYVIHGMLDKRGNAGFTMTSEVVMHNCVDQLGSSSSSSAKQRRESESQVPPSPSNSFAFVEPKQLNFNKIAECNLKASTSNSGKRRIVNSFEKRRCSLSVPALSMDEGISGSINQLPLHKQSQGMSDVSSKGESRRDCLEYDVHDNPDAGDEDFGPVISKYTMLQTSEDVTEAGLNYKISEDHYDTDNLPSEIVDVPDVQTHQSKLHVEHELESPERHMEEGNWCVEGKDKGQLMSNAHKNDNSTHSQCYISTEEPSTESRGCLIEKVGMTNPICVSLDNTKQFTVQESQILSHLEGEVRSQHADSPVGDNELVTCSTARSPRGENLSLERRFSRDSMKSWPQLKRRKIEHQQSHSFTTSPSFRVRIPHSFLRCPANMYLKNLELNVDTVLVETFDVNNTIDVEIHQEMDSHMSEGMEPTFLSQNGEAGIFHKEKNEDKNSSYVINDEQLEAALVSSLTKKEARDSQGCFVEGIKTSNHFEVREPGDGQCSQHLCSLEKRTDNLNSENLLLSDTLLEGIQPPKRRSGSHTNSILSSSNEDLEFIDVDKSMPVFEGFIVEAQADTGELDFTADRIDLDKLNLPASTIERASILAEICRSASLETPLSHFSSGFEFQETQNLFHSVPNVHLERSELVSTLPSDVDNQLQSGSSLADGYKDAFERMPYSDCLAYSGTRYGSNSRNQHASPVGKLWERLSSHAGSSEKSLSSNPELTCFPIEEDPSVSEESKAGDENADDVQEEIDSSSANHRDKRQPLKDLTNLGLDPPVSVSAQNETLGADSVDCVSTKLSVTGTQDTVQRSRKNQYRDKNETMGKQTSSVGASDGREHRTLSVGTNGIRKAKESINNSINKPILTNKTSLQRQDQKLSLKESRRNNIVLNVSSFIPLVQQKQVATVCTGKRDVKVKALEAAEAAKRLEEKKENERKMRKEALKLERAKLEEKNLRDMEIEKKKKEEERKKKAADIIAKKRLREEEERKEKENKRMRLEARQRQWEQDEKMRAEKAGKEKQRPKDEQIKSKKEFHNGSTKQQNRETVRGDDVALKDTETKWTTTGIAMNQEKLGISVQSCEAGKEMYTVDQSPKNEDLIVQKSQGKSYEISPYQCSDDEDEEDDELPAKKYIPSWASKSSVALLLPLQQKMDPDTIFPPESFCSMDEVLLPRKLRQNQVAG